MIGLANQSLYLSQQASLRAAGGLLASFAAQMPLVSTDSPGLQKNRTTHYAIRNPQSIRPLTETQRHGEKGGMVGRRPPDALFLRFRQDDRIKGGLINYNIFSINVFGILIAM